MANIEVKLNPDVKPTGSDLAVVNAARRSYGKRSTWDNQGFSHGDILRESDVSLLKFLARGITGSEYSEIIKDVSSEYDPKVLEQLLWDWRNTPVHDTPFNHCFISFEVKAPIFVVRQLVKHEYLILSEFSRRYITDDVEFYEFDCIRNQHPNKKQGSFGENPYNDDIVAYIDDHEVQSLSLFKHFISQGAAIEQARSILPLTTMTEFTWSGTLGAFCKMCSLRMGSDAQYETSLVAYKVYKYLQKYYPLSSRYLVEGLREYT